MEPIASGDSRCWLWETGIVCSLELVRLRGLLIMSSRLEVSSAGCRKSRKPRIEILEVTGAALLLMGP